MSGLRAGGFPEDEVRDRALRGAAAVFPAEGAYGREVFGGPAGLDRAGTDPLDSARLVPPVFMPERWEKLVELGREPLFSDVDLGADVGGFRSPLPLYVSAFGSTQVGSGLAAAVTEQAARLGVPVVIGENVAPVHGLGSHEPLFQRVRTYTGHVPDGLGGLVVQQSTEDADAEVWNRVYSDPTAGRLLESGRLAFELKLGQGAKPGLGGMTLVTGSAAAELSDRFTVTGPLGGADGARLRACSPGTFTERILDRQVRFMRNNFPRARIWVKLPPGRDVGSACATAWDAGAHAVTVDGAEGGSGWAPSVFLQRVGLSLADCLRSVDAAHGPLLVSGRMWEAGRAVVALALGARAVGLGRAALLAVDEDPEEGLVNLIRAFEFEARLLISALGKYSVHSLGPEDVRIDPR
ncbi:hypothetical protein SUDANB121_05585 [Nocardiopsis dassonvillei]|uniref:glutamate synthase-related protein n=1 Tax=Nocardiopsis dassonvillei TaxID=2014 RepID=UPI003F571FF6